jgi:hypothetical protein
MYKPCTRPGLAKGSPINNAYDYLAEHEGARRQMFCAGRAYPAGYVQVEARKAGFDQNL